jgi:hypothetical protein
MNKQIESIRKTIRDRSQEFCLDNPRLLGAEMVIETAMLIGASVVLGQPVDPDDNEAPELSDTPEGRKLLEALFGGPEDQALARELFQSPQVRAAGGPDE